MGPLVASIKKETTEKVAGETNSKSGTVTETNTNTTATVEEKSSENNTIKTSNAPVTVSITSPMEGSAVNVNDSLQIKAHLSNTDNLSLVKVDFSSQSANNTQKSSDIMVQMQVPAYTLGNVPIMVTAYYDYPDGKMKTYYDVKTVHITTNEVIQKFTVEPLLMNLTVDLEDRPDYKAVFKTFLTTSFTEPENFTVLISDPSVVSYNPKTRTFKGLKAGETSASITYRGITATQYFHVD